MFIILNLFPVVRADERCAWKSWSELGKAVSESSPDIDRLQEEKSSKNSLIELASLAPQAVASGQYTAGGLPWKSSNLEASYLWTLEKAEKRDARVAAARAGVDTLTYEIEDRRASQLLQIALIQQALRRLDARYEVLRESQSTYQKIIRQHEQRLSLGPEQEASLMVFRIAKKENDLKIETLDVDKSRYAYQLAAITGCRQITLPRTSSLGIPSRPDDPGDRSSSSIRHLEAQAKSLELSLQSDTYALESDLTLGPLLVAERDDDRSSIAFGVAASLPIGGERSRLLSTAKSAEYKARLAKIDNGKSQLKITRDAWMDQYQRSVKAMKGGLSKEELSKMHRRLESLFQGERVSAALVIEAHRQLLEHIDSYTALESMASEAIWNVRYLDGKIQWSDL